VTVAPDPAAKVSVPVPFLSNTIFVPIGKATAEFWGIVIVVAEPLVHKMKALASVRAGVRDVPDCVITLR